MKLTIFTLTVIASIALANDTVQLPPDAEEACRGTAVGGDGGTACCTYSDCGWCGFKQRCCHRYEDESPYEQGVCECGVNSFPQGTCT